MGLNPASDDVSLYHIKEEQKKIVGCRFYIYLSLIHI